VPAPHPLLAAARSEGHSQVRDLAGMRREVAPEDSPLAHRDRRPRRVDSGIAGAGVAGAGAPLPQEHATLSGGQESCRAL